VSFVIVFIHTKQNQHLAIVNLLGRPIRKASYVSLNIGLCEADEFILRINNK
jgi:hypothetical protein